MPDILDEVKEEIQDEQIQNFWKDHGTFLVIMVTLVISIVGGKSWWATYSYDRDTARTGQLISAIEGSVDDKKTFVAESTGGHKLVAHLLSSDFDSIVVADDYEARYEDLAKISSIGRQAENPDADFAKLLTDLKPLTQDSLYQASALELSAFLAAEMKDYKVALDFITRAKNLDIQNTSPDFIERMNVLIDYYTAQKAKESSS